MTRTTPAMAKTGHCRSWIFWAFSPAGCHVSCGASLAQPATSRPSADEQRGTSGQQASGHATDHIVALLQDLLLARSWDLHRHLGAVDARHDEAVRRGRVAGRRGDRERQELAAALLGELRADAGSGPRCRGSCRPSRRSPAGCPCRARGGGPRCSRCGSRTFVVLDLVTYDRLVVARDHAEVVDRRACRPRAA